MGFVSDPRIVELEPGRFTLTDALMYQGGIDVFEIPSEFRTDLASVPKVFGWFANPSSFIQPAILHDYLWSLNRKGEGPDPVDSDGLLRRCLREQGVGPVTRWLVWMAVRAAAIVAGRAGRWTLARLLPFWVAAVVAAVVMAPPAVISAVWLVVIRAADIVIDLVRTRSGSANRRQPGT